MMGKNMSLELVHASSCWVYEAYAAPFSFCIFLEPHAGLPETQDLCKSIGYSTWLALLPFHGMHEHCSPVSAQALLLT